MAPIVPSIRVGLDNLYYAILSTDTAGSAPIYGTPVHITNAVSANVQPKSNTTVFYADDGASETATAIGEIQLDFETNALPPSVVADLLGATYGNDGTVLQASTNNAPYVALGFRSKKANGKYRYKWLYKGKFQWYQEQAQTEEATPKGQPDKITGTFIRRLSDNAMQISADEDDPSFQGADSWFAAVAEATLAGNEPTVTVTPAAGATGVADTTTVAWVFSAAIAAGVLDASHFYVHDGAGNNVAGTLTQSADLKTITFTLTASFTTATSYTAVATASVRTTTGYILGADRDTTFTTA